jgi:hypothetical protein
VPALFVDHLPTVAGRPHASRQLPGDHLAPVIEPVALVERAGAAVLAVDVKHQPIQREVLLAGDPRQVVLAVVLVKFGLVAVPFRLVAGPGAEFALRLVTHDRIRSHSAAGSPGASGS